MPRNQRPKAQDGQLAIRMPQAEIDAIRRLAAKKGMTVSAFVRELMPTPEPQRRVGAAG